MRAAKRRGWEPAARHVEQPHETFSAKAAPRPPFSMPGLTAEVIAGYTGTSTSGLKQRDIRKILGHHCGRDRLLDGSWQRDRLAIMEAEQGEANTWAGD